MNARPVDVNEATTRAHDAASTRTQSAVLAARLDDYGMGEETLAAFVELLIGLQMQAWHEGVLAGIDVLGKRIAEAAPPGAIDTDGSKR